MDWQEHSIRWARFAAEQIFQVMPYAYRFLQGNASLMWVMQAQRGGHALKSHAPALFGQLPHAMYPPFY
jgi:hypothetical protein